MNIGFYFECNKKSGGVFQYALNMLSILKSIGSNNYFVFNMSEDFPFDEYCLPNWKIINMVPVNQKTQPLSYSSLQEETRKYNIRRKINLFIIKLLRSFGLFNLEMFLARQNSKRRAQEFNAHGLDLMIFHGPSELSFLTKIPAIIPVHDLQHKINVRFPEVSQKGMLAKRDYIMKNIDNNAYRIMVPTDLSKEDLKEMYGIADSKIRVAHPFPVDYITDKASEQEMNLLMSRYNLPKKFLFYPAQFWPHKNHINLIKAIKILRGHDENIPLVLVGSKQELWGEFGRVKNFIRENRLEKLIYLLGYVENADANTLYHAAYALVMPTYLGPIQFPVIEAWRAGCPVICSEARGSRKEIGDSALFFDPDNPKDIAEKIKILWDNPDLRKGLIENGYKKSKNWSRENYAEVLKNIIEDFRSNRLKR